MRTRWQISGHRHTLRTWLCHRTNNLHRQLLGKFFRIRFNPGKIQAIIYTSVNHKYCLVVALLWQFPPKNRKNGSVLGCKLGTGCRIVCGVFAKDCGTPATDMRLRNTGRFSPSASHKKAHPRAWPPGTDTGIFKKMIRIQRDRTCVPFETKRHWL